MNDPLPEAHTPPMFATVDPGDVIDVAPKNPLGSTTVQGLAVAIVARLIRVVVEKHFPGVVTDEAWVPIATEIVGWVIGGIMILIGRWHATRPLGFGVRVNKVVK